jgi:predicted O-methyltransferase YrrM
MKFFKKKSEKKLKPFPFKADHIEYSTISSSHDDVSFPTEELLNLSFKAIQQAPKVDLSDISKRMSSPPFYPDIWPGEHYKLLSSFVQVLKPKVVIEIGTYTGISSLALKKYLPKDSKIITFDILHWKEFEDTVLKESDFSDKRLIQYADDLTDDFYLNKHFEILKKANLIFVDAVHDGKMEEKLFQQFEKIPFETNPYVILDDIRVWGMLKAWRDIKKPKMDLTSFGHWSGTGLLKL